MDRSTFEYSMSYKKGNDISCLPTLDQLVDSLKELQAVTPVRHLSPMHIVASDPDKYIITRLMSGRYSIKPNISRQSFLYRGESQDYALAVPKEFRSKNNDDILLANIRFNDFHNMLESHPFYRMLKNGIKLSERETIRIENPYGMASCYGLDTLNLSFTSSLDVAAFYAVSHYDAGNNTFTQVEKEEDKPETQVGAIYAFFLAIPFPTILGLSSVGFIPFPHLENQRTFIFQMSRGITFQQHQFQQKFYFRHDKEKDKVFFEKFHKGEDLTVEDEILQKARSIVSGTEVSKTAFLKNLHDNPRDKEDVNKERLSRLGIQITDVDYTFNTQELTAYRQRMSQGYWNRFCSQLIFEELRTKEAKEIFLDLPNNPLYTEYFR